VPGAASEVRIRAARPEDAPAFRALLDAVARERRFLAMIEAPDLEQVRSFLERLDDGGGVQQLALIGERVVGWCDIIRDELAGFGHGGRLGMGVAEDHRGSGLGERLLLGTLDAAAELGMWRVELDVFASNTRAVALYERTGFAHEGRKKSARILDGQEDDILLMACVRPPGAD
jgi:RimJ/RimL family protein N-acetyltransferase